MEKKLKEILIKAGCCFSELFCSSINAYFDDVFYSGRNEGRNEQRQRDIKSAIIMMCELSISEDSMYKYLAEYWGVDSRAEATAYIEPVVNIHYPFRKLQNYLLESGLSYNEMRDFMENNEVKRQLEQNPKLHTLPVEKLKQKVENNIIPL